MAPLDLVHVHTLVADSLHDTCTRVPTSTPTTTTTGNGPAGIALSLMLSGHWPYFTGAHPHPYLTLKLGENPDLSLLEQVSSLFTQWIETL